MLKKSLVIIISALIISSFAACTGNAGQSSSSSSSASSVTSGSSVSADSSSSGNSSSSGSEEVTFSGYEKGIIDTTNLFTKRDLTQTADTSSAKTLEVSDGQTLKITEEGVYVIKGIAKNCTIRVEADDTAKVQLVLDGVSITNDSTPAIYVVSADKCFVTTGADSTLSVTGAFTADSDTNTDAVIFSKDDLVLNGTAALTINSAQGLHRDRGRQHYDQHLKGRSPQREQRRRHQGICLYPRRHFHNQRQERRGSGDYLSAG